MPTLLRRLLLWTVICAVSAAPSFFLASSEFSRPAMVFGVCLFIAAYTAATSTRAFERFHGRPFVRRTLYIGYGLRLAASCLMPIGFIDGGGSLAGVLMLPDILPGILSVGLVQNVLRIEEHSFIGTLLITIVQGTLLNLIVFFLMLAIWGAQRLFLKLPPESAPRGFDVLLESPRTAPLTVEVKP